MIFQRGLRFLNLSVGGFAICLYIALLLAGHVESARAVQPAPALQLTTVGVPTILPPGEGRRGKYDIVVENTGAAATEGPITVKDELPPGLNVAFVQAEPEQECSESSNEITCTFNESLIPGGFLVVNVHYTTGAAAGTLTNNVNVTGGGAPPTTASTITRVGAEHEHAPPGISQFRFEATGPAGEPVTQAGGHPHFLTTMLQLNNMFVESVAEPTKPVEAVKDLVFYLPLGVLGNSTVIDQCPAAIVETRPNQTGCPLSSRVGALLPMITNNVFANGGDPTHGRGIYNVIPEKGYAAEFAFTASNYTFFLYANVVRHNGSYALRVSVPGLPGVAYFIGMVATFDGDIREEYPKGEEPFTFDRGSFLTDPSDCGATPQALSASAVMNTWEHPYTLDEAEATPGFGASTPGFAGIEGCGLLSFSTKLSVNPETSQADEPSGYEVGLEVPQAPNDPSGLGTPPLKNVTVTLPRGTTISPASANGLSACQETGADGINIEGPESEELAPDGLERPVAGHCPLASRIATVEATTPLLHESLTGHLFLAAPQCGGAGQHACSDEDATDGKLFRLYMELEAPNAGVVIKLEGHASVQPGTGRITTVFDDAPQFPVSKLVAKLKTGPHAPIANPLSCGAATTNATIAPWSEPQTPASTPSSAFDVDWDGAGGACPGSRPFAPSFVAGTIDQAAGTSSPFLLTLGREDREQNVRSLRTTLPEGLLANISKVARCPEPQASLASLTACPANSQIGTATATVGPGSDPYRVTGKVFLTGEYNGAPLGLSVVVPAVAGPFNLGDVLVRVALFVDPRTLQVTAVSGPLPPELDGVPLQIRTLEVLLDAHEFTLNPTSCSQMSVTAAVASTSGAVANVASPFTTGGCKYLPFHAQVTGATEQIATKAEGTGVKLKVAFPVGHEANLAKFVMSFPTELPVRHETLEQACPAATFEANPAACPMAATVGHSTVNTPLLAQPLSGPIYLVSYGSAKFPAAVLVLQGEGITLQLTGESNVSSKGVLTLTVPSAPDAPFSTFEAVLPKGPFSEFTSSRTSGRAQGSQCGANLTLGVQMTAQNGAQIDENPKLEVPGCKAPKPSVKIIRARANHRGLAMTVKTSMRGRLKIDGHGLKTLIERNLAPGKHTVTVTFTRAGKAAARKHRYVKVAVELVAGQQRVKARGRVVLRR